MTGAVSMHRPPWSGLGPTPVGHVPIQAPHIQGLIQSLGSSPQELGLQCCGRESP